MNAKKLAWVLLIYTCLFVLDDTPFTSVWDNLPQTGVEELICAEDQEESLAIVTLLKTRLRSASTNRPTLVPMMHLSVLANLTRINSSLRIQSGLTSMLIYRELSVNYCIFRI